MIFFLSPRHTEYVELFFVIDDLFYSPMVREGRLQNADSLEFIKTFFWTRTWSTFVTWAIEKNVYFLLTSCKVKYAPYMHQSSAAAIILYSILGLASAFGKPK